MNLREVTMNNGVLNVFLRNDSAEIWGFRYGLTLVIGTLKVMARTGVFVWRQRTEETERQPRKVVDLINMI
jgi:hypothetical protein